MGARRGGSKESMQRMFDLFDTYGLGPEVADMYPYELSGGMLRRVLLCCVLMDEPRLIVADEPTPGLDLDLAVDPRMRMEDVLQEAGAIEPELNGRMGIRSEWMRRFPHELSGGELQRFCIVRALMANPRYLIADEISTMLDAVTQAQIWHALMEEAEFRGLGMVIVSRSPRTCRARGHSHGRHLIRRPSGAIFDALLSRAALV